MTTGAKERVQISIDRDALMRVVCDVTEQVLGYRSYVLAERIAYTAADEASDKSGSR